MILFGVWTIYVQRSRHQPETLSSLTRFRRVFSSHQLNQKITVNTTKGTNSSIITSQFFNQLGLRNWKSSLRDMAPPPPQWCCQPHHPSIPWRWLTWFRHAHIKAISSFRLPLTIFLSENWHSKKLSKFRLECTIYWRKPWGNWELYRHQKSTLTIRSKPPDWID